MDLGLYKNSASCTHTLWRPGSVAAHKPTRCPTTAPPPPQGSLLQLPDSAETSAKAFNHMVTHSQRGFERLVLQGFISTLWPGGHKQVQLGI